MTTSAGHSFYIGPLGSFYIQVNYTGLWFLNAKDICFRYGHEDTITSIDSLTRERAITAGGRDGSIRIWKVVEESQLVFHGHM